MLDYLKKCLDAAKGRWAEELLGVLRAYCTTKRQPMGETHSSLAYGMEAIILTKIQEPTLRTTITDIK